MIKPAVPHRGSVALARLHGLFNLVGGMWPLVHMSSFEDVLGPKSDRWLVRTVAGLMVGNGLVQIGTGRSGAELVQARRLGMATALTLCAIDLLYAPTGRISRVYLVDAALEAAWIAVWCRTRPTVDRRALAA